MEKWDGELKWDGKWTKEFLKEHPLLMIDTKWFGEEFKFELLSAFNDLDDELGGLSINSENFQAINLIKAKFHSKVKSVYIYPPYNYKSTEDMKSTRMNSSYVANSYICYCFNKQ